MEEEDKKQIQICPNSKSQYWISCNQFGNIYSYGSNSRPFKKNKLTDEVVHLSFFEIIELYEIITHASGEILFILKQSHLPNHKLQIKPENRLKYFASLILGNNLYSNEIKYLELKNLLNKNKYNAPKTRIVDLYEIKTDEFGFISFAKKTIDDLVDSEDKKTEEINNR
ncbi:MAG: hypothetical protein WC755_00985 [Candidatus Woesearchaeota archaeon]|jgi:hypothetical protein